ncbi:MAG: hypothetical protein RLZZ499_339 [Cyanobacteriota bacterium]
MHHNTYDRFCGSWWGSIIGQTIVNQINQFDDPLTQTWLLKRRQIAQMILTQKLNTTNSLSFLALQSAGDDLKYHSNLLSLLPLIIFQTDEANLSLKLAKQPNLETVNSPSNIFLSQDILIWSYLLTTVLNHHKIAQKELLIQNVFQPNLRTKSPLIEMLNIVVQGIKNGSSLHQLTEQLLTKDRLQATAIALSWYCFATTPHDFKLSVQRAARVDSKLAWLTTSLTSTLSGAYNGVTKISGNWRAEIEQNQSWDLENHLLLKLFRFWLGIYPSEQNNESYNLELDAIASPKFIQSRQSLKIISQSSSS